MTDKLYATVPKELGANLAWRRETRERAKKDNVFREAVKAACAKSLLYWINGFVWLTEQREERELPFISWDYQDDALLTIDRCIGQKDLAIEKSRDMGATWMILAVFLWRWQFRHMQSFAVSSRSEELVFEEGNPDCLFWKLHFMVDQQPSWLLPNMKRLKKRLINTDLRSDIKGYATTDDFGRGGRRLAVLIDEFGAYFPQQSYQVWTAAQYTTKCRIINSTPKNPGAFRDYRAKIKNGLVPFENAEILRLHWTQHPQKIKNLRQEPDGRWRSDYYDEMVAKEVSAQKVAQELDIDDAGAAGGFFDLLTLEKLTEEVCRPPLRTGRLTFDPDSLEPLEWVDDPKGPINLWCNLVNGKPPPGYYAEACDIAAGTGVTPSCACVGDMQTGEQVAEYADAWRYPADFTRDAIALAKWFHKAHLCWETAGSVGSTFKKVLMESDYRNLYYRNANEDNLTPKPTDLPGWYPSTKTIGLLFNEFRDALGNEYTPRSAAMLKDCVHYVYTADGVEHEGAKATEDKSGATLNHGDRAVASALCWKLIKEGRKLAAKPNQPQKGQPEVRPGSVAWMMREEKKAKEIGEGYGGLRL